MQQIGYIRVSTIDQRTERQLDGIKLDRTFTDKCSGSTTQRPALQQLKDHVREGDTVVVHSIDRMARNLEDLLELINYFSSKGVQIRFVKESMTFGGTEPDPMQKLMLSIMGSVAEFERAIILERQREGIALAKERGAYKGRKPSVDREQVLQLHSEGVAKAQIAKRLGIGRATVYRILDEQANNEAVASS
ncbi:recombinase family protein [Pseudidiomarina sp. 1APP75-32.1]|uniref:Recombinase family protein n=1 Tax=Pseudidiomarina terrestris TaxID=2820060 RepID=A0AAW7R1R4_9GAMM|nr:recombinase family protein [Pseudidiomarina sp. 1APP75-32.1]MDN7125058.1 recombinase family protein [Pseudidiomarina sp. 1APP75-32.1]